MRVIATSVVRESVHGQQRSGSIYDIDWENGQVKHCIAVPDPRYPQSDANPRGGVRGGRGVAVTREGIVVANHDTLLRYDDDWKLLDSFDHPLLLGMHEIEWDGGHVWVASTAIDALVRVTLDHRVDVAWDPHASPLARRYSVRERPQPLEAGPDYRTGEGVQVDRFHLNGVASRDGVMVVNCGLAKSRPAAVSRALRRVRPGGARPTAASLVVRLDGRNEPSVLVEIPGHAVPTHNGQMLDRGRVAINDSTSNTLRIYAADDGREVQALAIEGSWLRGMEPVAEQQLLLGTAPAAIVQVDLDANAVVRRLQLSDNPFEAIHGLVVCPPPDQRR